MEGEPSWVETESRQPVSISTTLSASDLEGSLPVRNIDLAMRMNARAPEPWALTVNDDPVIPGTRGKLHAAPTTATGIRLIGKEGRRWRDSRNILPGPEVSVYAFRDDGEAQPRISLTSPACRFEQFEPYSEAEHPPPEH